MEPTTDFDSPRKESEMEKILVAYDGTEPSKRALAAAARRVAAQPQVWAAGHADAIAILMRRTLTRTRAPILSSLTI